MGITKPAAAFLVCLLSAASSPAVLLECDPATGPAGGTATLTVRFSADPDETVGGTQNDLTFDSSRILTQMPGGTAPNCSISPDIGPGTVPDKRLARSFINDDAGQVRAIVFSQENREPIPPGSLYSCVFELAADAEGEEIGIGLVDAVVSDPAGDRLPATTAPCSIVVTEPLPTPTPPGFCEDDDDCPEPQVCVDNRCATPTPPGFCTDDQDCPPDQVCVDERCATRTPTPTPDGFCREDDDCDGGVCIDNRCATPTPEGYCEDDDDCPEGETCIDNRCTAPSPTPEGFCRDDDDCAEGEICIDERCATPTPKRGGGGGCGCSVEPDPPLEIAFNLFLAALPAVWLWRRRRSTPL